MPFFQPAQPDEVPMPPGPGGRIPVKLHRRVCLVYTEDAVLAEEVLSRRKLAEEVVGRLTDQVLLIRPGRAAAVVEELRRMGHTPRVVEGPAPAGGPPGRAEPGRAPA
jgi:hypothetical protein